MLPDVPDEELEYALRRVVAVGNLLPDRPKSERDISPLLSLAAGVRSESYPVVARRLLAMLDQSFKDNAGDAAGVGDSLLSDDSSLGLRILFGTALDYHGAPADSRRREAFELIFPGRQKVPTGDGIYRTWEPPMMRLALKCLRASYGQERPVGSRTHQSVRRLARAVVGPDRRLSYVESSHVSRSIVDGLREVRMRLHHPLEGCEVEFEGIAGVGKPRLEHYAEGHIRAVFPLLEVVSDGEEFSWTYRRSYHYQPETPPPPRDGVAVTGNTPGYVASVAVTFQGEVAPKIWHVTSHSLNIPVSFDPAMQTFADSTGTAVLPDVADTRIDFTYGINWMWK